MSEVAIFEKLMIHKVENAIKMGPPLKHRINGHFHKFVTQN